MSFIGGFTVELTTSEKVKDKMASHLCTLYSGVPLYVPIEQIKDCINFQICIAFAIHRGTVVIPKTVNPTRIEENLKATEVKLDAEDMKRLRELDRNTRMLNVS